MPGDEVLYDERFETPSGGIVAVYVRETDPEQYPDGVYYRLHYGFPDEDHPVVRYDNAHGYHERHEGSDRERFDFPGPAELYDRFVTEVLRHERRRRTDR